MDDSLLDPLTTVLSESENSVLTEGISLYNSTLFVPNGVSQMLQDLLIKKKDLRCQFQAAYEDKLILDEFLKDPQEWKTARDAGNEEEQHKQLTIELETRLHKMMDSVSVATEALDTWKRKADMVSQKVHELKSKKTELGESINLSKNSLSLHRLEVKNKIEKVKVLLEAAEAEKAILKDRIARMESSLQCLFESQSELERKYSQQKMLLQSLKQTLGSMQSLSGLECFVMNDNVLRVILQPKELMSFLEMDNYGDEDLEESKFAADLIFAVNNQGHLEVSDVQTNQKGGEVQELITNVKQDKDLPKFVSSLRNTWLSFLPLSIEISCLRKSHGIDFIQEKGIVQLMIHKRSIVCTLDIPKSYPSTDVTLVDVIGSDLTMDKILAPQTKNLTAWVKHLENLLGQDKQQL